MKCEQETLKSVKRVKRLCVGDRGSREGTNYLYREWGSGAAVAVWDARQRLNVGLIGAYA